MSSWGSPGRWRTKTGCACCWPCGAASCACARSPSCSGWPLSTTSKHLSILYQAGLLDARKEGRWIYYSLAGKEAPRAAREAIRWVARALAEDRRIAEDAARPKKVLALDPVELCKRQCRK